VRTERRPGWGHAGRLSRTVALARTRAGLAGASGFTVLEALLASSIAVIVAAISVPATTSVLDDARTGMAARYLEGRILNARAAAVRRSARIGLRFEATEGDYRVAEYVDGNGNGVRGAEIAAGIDLPLAPAQRIGELFPGVSFGLLPGVPDVDGGQSSSTDGVRIGTGRILTLGPDGTASSGTLYVRGRRGQYAIRILGATGRTRVLRFQPMTMEWVAR